MWSISDIVLFLLTDQQMGRWGRERQLPSQVDLNTANLAATLSSSYSSQDFGSFNKCLNIMKENKMWPRHDCNLIVYNVIISFVGENVILNK